MKKDAHVPAGEVQDSSGAVYRSAAHYGAAELHPSVRVVAVEADIYFPNVEDLQDSLAELREQEAVSAQSGCHLHARRSEKWTQR